VHRRQCSGDVGILIGVIRTGLTLVVQRSMSPRYAEWAAVWRGCGLGPVLQRALHPVATLVEPYLNSLTDVQEKCPPVRSAYSILRAPGWYMRTAPKWRNTWTARLFGPFGTRSLRSRRSLTGPSPPRPHASPQAQPGSSSSTNRASGRSDRASPSA